MVALKKKQKCIYLKMIGRYKCLFTKVAQRSIKIIPSYQSILFQMQPNTFAILIWFLYGYNREVKTFMNNLVLYLEVEDSFLDYSVWSVSIYIYSFTFNYN